LKNTRRHFFIAIALVGVLVFATTGAQAQTETVETRIGKLEFTHDFANGYPTKETVAKLYDERDFQRACQIYLWAIPFVSFGQFEHVLMAVPGAADAVRRVRTAGLEVCVASQGSLAKTRLSLELTGMRDLFPDRALFSAESVSRGKPHPDLFLYAAKEMGAEPSACAVVTRLEASNNAAVANFFRVMPAPADPDSSDSGS